MSAVVDTPWYRKLFETRHEAVDINRYCVADSLKYMGRWFEEKGLVAPEVKSVVVESTLRLVTGGNSIHCSSRADVASALNAYWLLQLSKLGIQEMPLPDEMIDLSLLLSRAPLEEVDQPLLEVAMQCGQANFWISRAWDPEFNRDSFAKVRSLAALEAVFRHGNWSLGTAFVYRELAFINQINGGDEWLVIRKDAGSFESWSAGYALERDPAAVQRFVEDCLAATAAELKSLDYPDARFRKQ